MIPPPGPEIGLMSFGPWPSRCCGERRTDEGDEEEEDDEDRACERELVSAEAQPDALPVAACCDCRDLIVLLGELRAEEAALEIALEVRANGAGRGQRVALRDARLALRFAAFDGVVWCGAHREVKSIAPLLVGS